MKIFLYFILLIITETKSLEWCEEIDQSKQKIILTCIQNEKMNEINCQRKHFYLKENNVIFDKHIQQENVEIQCDQQFDENIFVFSSNENVTFSYEIENQQNQKNSILKGVSYCYEHYCNNFCHQCNAGY